MKQQQIKFKFVRPPGVTVACVNGYWVNTTITGKLLVDMFYQYPKCAESVTFQLDELGKLGKEIDREAPDVLVREILASLELTPEMAMDFGTYLVETARSMGIKYPGEFVGSSPTKQ